MMSEANQGMNCHRDYPQWRGNSLEEHNAYRDVGYLAKVNAENAAELAVVPILGELSGSDGEW
jgi:hypothetical protein